MTALKPKPATNISNWLLFIPAVLLVLFSIPQISYSQDIENNYEFEGMWPELSQSHYFQAPEGITIDTEGNIYVADSGNNRIKKFNSNMTLITSWGSSGNGDGEFNKPKGIEVDNNGYVYVVDVYNHRIQKFTSEGEFVSKWGTRGSEDAQFINPQDLAIDVNGYVYVSDAANDRIQKFTTDGDFIDKWGTVGNGDGELYYPSGIAIDQNGYVCVVEVYNNRIQIFTPDGEFVSKWGTNGTGTGEFGDIFSIAVDADNYYYIGDTYLNRIHKFTSEGQYVLTIEKSYDQMDFGSDFIYPAGIAIGADGSIYMVDDRWDRVIKFTCDGELIDQWKTFGNKEGEFNTPRGVFVDDEGYVHVADTNNNRIQKFTLGGQFVGNLGLWEGEGLVPYPYDIATDNEGYLYLAIDNMNIIRKFDKNYNLITQWGSTGTGDGQLDCPSAIASDSNGHVYVVDSGNFRIQKFDANGTFQDKWGSYGTEDGQFSYPQDMAIDTNDNIYIVDAAGNDRIQVFNSNGEYITQWGSEGAYDGEFIGTPRAVEIDNEGFVWVADSSRIQKFTPDGQFILKIGELGSEEGQFNNPKRIAFSPHGRLYIADTGNNRIQVFKPAGDADPDDTDDDGMPDDWENTYFNDLSQDGTGDYEQDGLTDLQEYNLGSNPTLVDSDNDGLSDLQEYNSGTNPSYDDTDYDGLSDMEEYNFGSSPTLKDTDGDGLSDLAEYNCGSSPTLQDTDGDGLSDPDECYYGTNPADDDTDEDGLTDLEEWELWTDPLKADTDNDGMPDGWEVQYGLDPLVNNSNQDYDDDGIADLQEFQNGTDPTVEDTDGDGFTDLEEHENGTDPNAATYLITDEAMIESPNWTAESDQAGSHFGSTVASAGDVNGDGYQDIIVSAPGYDNENGGVGRVFVYYGSAFGLSSTPDWTAESDEDIGFGSTAGTAGDVNGDGYSDIIIGAPSYSNGEEDEGMIFIYYGSASGLSSTADWTLESNHVFASFGESAATAGDVNGDGYSDIIVGVPGYVIEGSNTLEGRVFVYYGSPSGPSSIADWTTESDTFPGLFGRAIASAGDVNGDGYSDVIIGSPLSSNNEPWEGSAYIYYGSSTGLSITPDWTVESNEDYSLFGSSVSTAGDVNKDGYSDILIANGQYSGKVFLFYGSPNGLGTVADWHLESKQIEDYIDSSGWVMVTPWFLDYEVSTAGDVNGDTYSDILIGAYKCNAYGHNHGRVFVYCGTSSGLGGKADWIIEQSQPDSSFGDSIASAGDTNGDGYSDIMVGAPSYDNGERDEGGAFVYYGSSFDDDTDGDFIPDGIEKKYCPDSNDSDTDDDGIFDGEEDANYNGIFDSGETDPCNADTDEDGMPDSWEIQYDFDPLSGNGGNDYDDDGVTDLQEYQNGTNPIINTDSDSDGMPDDWEMLYFGGTSRDGAGDFDDDDLADLAEYGHKTNPTATDTDWDGYTDGEEVLYGSDPILISDTPESHIPSTPVFTEDTDTTDVALRYHLFKVAGFNDPDGDSLASSEWQISTDENFSEGKIILHKTLELGTGILAEESDLLLFTMSETLFLADKDYWIRVRLTDNTGLSSVWSDPLTFFTVMENPYDLDADGIDDQYEAGQDTDTNTNGVNDSEEGILALSDAEYGKTTGVSINIGTLNGLTSLSTADLPDGILDGIQMPYGLFSYRIDGLTPGATVDITFYFPDAIPSDAGWYKYDSADGDIYDYTENINIDGNKVVMSITDGGPGDEDGLANGTIIDPSGPVFAQDADTDTDTDDGTGDNNRGNGGGGGCFIATAAYGSAGEQHVMILREFRDRFLLKHTLGRVFVVQYYKYSPPMADYISRHDTIRMFVRWGLLPLVWLSQAFIFFGHLGFITFCIMMSVILFGAYLLILKIRSLSIQSDLPIN